MEIAAGILILFLLLWLFIFCAHHGSAAEAAQDAIADKEQQDKEA